MILLLALLLPFAISFVTYKLAGRKITPKELAVQLAAVTLIVGTTYAIMLWRDTGDTELINGQIVEKTADTMGCCHSYQCMCYTSCTGSGTNQTCTEHCSTCYEHSHDLYWDATSSTGKVVYSNRCNSPHTATPKRWEQIYVGEPTVQEHNYTNYIKGNPTSILRREAVAPRLLAQVPEYPEVFDYYRTMRVLDLGVVGVDVQALNHELSYINTQLGPKHQVDIILIITKEADPTFAEAVRQKWLGGKKNDVVVIVGAPEFPAIAWVDTVSWTREEEMKVRIRDSILAMHTFDGHNVLGVIAFEVDHSFKRRHMKDFKYLMAGIEPSTTQIVVLFSIALVVCLGLLVLMYRVDLFDEERPVRIPGVYRRF